MCLSSDPVTAVSQVDKILFLGTTVQPFYHFLVVCGETSCLKLYLQVIRQVTGNIKRWRNIRKKQKDKTMNHGPPLDKPSQGSSVRALPIGPLEEPL